MGFETGYLAESMNASVGAPGAVQKNLFLRQALEHIDDFSLNGRLVRLHLPAVEIRAVVGNGELEMTHQGERTLDPAKAPCAQSGCPASGPRCPAGKAGNLPAHNE